jgi:hypothetical protein
MKSNNKKLKEMKTKYLTPKVTVVPFEVESGFTASVNETVNHDIMFHFLETGNDASGARFGNDQFANTATSNDYNFFGD